MSGMMDGAYFTSRNEILTFFNTLLDLNLTKIEQTASGAVACQLTEYIFPNSIPMSRVNWGAKSSHEYVANYKLLQNAFNKHNIQRHVDVDKLIRGKYQDNLEFCQWLKAFFDQTSSMMNGGRVGYDPVAVRAKGKGGNNLSINKIGVKRVGAAATSTSSSTASSRVMVGNARIGATRSASNTATTANSRPTSSGSVASSMTRASISTSNSRVSTTSSGGISNGGQKENASNSIPLSSSSSSRQVVPSNPQKQQQQQSSSLVPAAIVTKYEEEIRALQSENQSLQSKYSQLEYSSATIEMTLQTVESERDFYFEKLRGIEVMLQVYKEKEEEEVGSGNIVSVMDGIFKVMYATMEDNVVVDDEGNVSQSFCLFVKIHFVRTWIILHFCKLEWKLKDISLARR
jgi:RP/EB family microtubule-associated protein